MVVIVLAVAYTFVVLAGSCFAIAALAVFRIEPFMTFVKDIAPPVGVIPLVLYGCITLVTAAGLFRLALTVSEHKTAWRKREREIARTHNDPALWTDADTYTSTRTGERHASRASD